MDDQMTTGDGVVPVERDNADSRTAREMTNIVPFPKRAGLVEISRVGTPLPYEFNDDELAALCRWYSAMRYAFPAVQAVMAVCRSERLSAIGLYGEGGTTPNCLLTKHEADDVTHFVWVTDQDPPRTIATLREITETQIAAIAPPPDEAAWLDHAGWSKVGATRTFAGSPAADRGGALGGHWLEEGTTNAHASRLPIACRLRRDRRAVARRAGASRGPARAEIATSSGASRRQDIASRRQEGGA